MYELIQLSEHDYYMDCPAKVGLVCIGAQEVAAIDSGSGKDAGKKLLRILESRNWKLTAIYQTHSHADHIGGSRFLQERTGCRVFARGMECDFTNHPLLEPLGLYGGFPPEELRGRFLMAQECFAEPLTDACLPEGLTMIELPGHSFDMVGFRTADGNVFLADCVSSAATLEKYGISYLWDVEASLQTLENIQKLDALQYIPSHAPVTDEICTLAAMNRDAILRTADELLRLCETPVCFEELLKLVFDTFHMTMTAEQFALIGSTVRSYLSWLKKCGKVEFQIEENRMLWNSVV